MKAILGRKPDQPHGSLEHPFDEVAEFSKATAITGLLGTFADVLD